MEMGCGVDAPPVTAEPLTVSVPWTLRLLLTVTLSHSLIVRVLVPARGGTTAGSRVVNLWNNVTVSSSLTVGGQTYLTKRTGWTALPGATSASGLQPPMYCVDELGYVRLRGALTLASGSSATTVQVTLPAGASPANQIFFSGITNNNVAGTLYISTNGQVQWNSSAYSGFITLESFSFPLG